jgi:predicted TIM-barrel fold metal-dependent hydrolase
MVKSNGSVIDGDGHVVETASRLAPFGWEGSTYHEKIDRMLQGWDRPERWKAGLHPDAIGAWNPEDRLADMDREGIERAVNYPSALLAVGDVGSLPDQTSLCRAYNDWFFATYRSTCGDRMLAVAVVPVGDPAAAVVEARRAVVELGAVGIVVPPYVGARHLDDGVFDPLWSLAVELDVPVGVHGGRSVNEPHIHESSFRTQTRWYAFGHPFHQMFAMTDIVLGGVLARFPTLRVAFLEAGIAWMPYWIERLDHAVDALRDQENGAEPAIDRKPSEYLLGGNCYFSCEPDEPNLAVMVDWLGEDQVIFASDYPHFDCSFPDSVQELVKGSGLSEGALAKVTGTNPGRLYNL